MDTFHTLKQQINTALNHSQATKQQTSRTLINFRDSVPGPSLQHDVPQFFQARATPTEATAVSQEFFQEVFPLLPNEQKILGNKVPSKYLVVFGTKMQTDLMPHTIPE